MKIVRIETLWLYAVPQAEWQAAQGALRQALPNNLWVQIVTDDGRVGLGETYYVPRAVAAIDDRGSRRLRSMSMSELKIYVGGAAALRGVHRRGAPPDLHGGRDGAVAFGRQQAGNRAGGRHGRDRSGFVGAGLVARRLRVAHSVTTRRLPPYPACRRCRQSAAPFRQPPSHSAFSRSVQWSSVVSRDRNTSSRVPARLRAP